MKTYYLHKYLTPTDTVIILDCEELPRKRVQPVKTGEPVRIRATWTTGPIASFTESLRMAHAIANMFGWIVREDV